MTVRLRSNILLFLFFLSILTLIYLPCITSYYVFHDELSFFEGAINQWKKLGHHDITIASGRALGAFIAIPCNFFINYLPDLNFFRMINIIVLSLCSIFFYKSLELRIKNKIENISFVVLIMTLPSFAIFPTNVGMLYCTFGLLLGGISAHVIDTSIYNNHKRFVQPKSMLISSSLLVAALYINQSAAMIYWAFLAIHIIYAEPNSTQQQWWKKTINFIIPGLFSIGLYVLSLKIMEPLLRPKSMGLHNPYLWTSDITQKFQWFINEPLINALNLWNVFPNVRTTIIVSGFIVTGSIMLCIKNYNHPSQKKAFNPIVKPILILTTIILGFLPNLVAQSNAPFYRCTGTMATIFLLLLIWAIKEIVSFITNTKNSKSFIYSLIASTIFAGIHTYGSVYALRSLPSSMEITYIKDIIQERSIVKNPYHTTHIILADKDILPHRYDEFGGISSMHEGNIQFLIKLAYRELGIEESLYSNNIRLSVSSSNETIQYVDDILYFDMNILAKQISQIYSANPKGI